VVGILSLADGVTGPSLTDDSRNLTLHSMDDQEEHVISLSTNPVLHGSTKSDKDNGHLDFSLTTEIPTPSSRGNKALHNTTVGMEDINGLPVFPNHTVTKETDFIQPSSMEHTVSLITESGMENQENSSQLLSVIDRIPNASVFRNHTLYVVENRKLNCAMIKNMTFIFTLGRKMPFFINIVCLIIGIIGIIGNIATIAVVVINVKLRKPYFLTILTLAVADLLSVILKIVGIFLEYELRMYTTCIRPSYYVVVSFFISVDTNSILQVVLIAVIKFLLLVCPIKSKQYVTNNLIVVLCFILWSFSACFAFSACYLVMVRVEANEDISALMIGILSTTIFPSTMLIIILHFVKVVKLRKSQALQKEVQKMNQVVTIILGIYIMYNLQKIMIVQNFVVFKFLNQSILISSFIHHASNPLIYVAFTPLVQRPWKRLKERFRTG
jgi:hypothetical protein